MQLDPDIAGRAAQARVARLATIRPDRRPHVVPITFDLREDTIVTAIDHKPKTTARLQRIRNIEANSAASVVIDHYDDDWSRLWWVRGDGEARVVVDGPLHDDAMERLAAKYPPYRDTATPGPVIIVVIARWASWSS